MLSLLKCCFAKYSLTHCIHLAHKTGWNGINSAEIIQIKLLQ